MRPVTVWKKIARNVGMVGMLAGICLSNACSSDVSVNSPEEDLRLVGKWESVARSNGGIGATFEFLGDGSATFTPGALVDFTYRLEGSRLFRSFEDPDTGSESETIVDIQISADTMIQRIAETGQETVLVRVGSAEAGRPPIVGTWSFDHSAGVTAFEIFTADGELHLRVPFVTVHGRYTLSNDTLTIELERQGRADFRYSIDGSTLTLRTTDGAPEQYRKVLW